MSFSIRPHCRYRTHKRGMRARVVIAVANGLVTFHPEGQPERPAQQTEGDFRTWAELAGVKRGTVLRNQ